MGTLLNTEGGRDRTSRSSLSSSGSVYDLINPNGTIMRSHFWEDFSGGNLDKYRWGTRHSNTSNSRTHMGEDTVGQGLQLIVDATSDSAIAFGFSPDGTGNARCTHRPFSHISGNIISVLKFDTYSDYSTSGAGGGFNSDNNVSGGIVNQSPYSQGGAMIVVRGNETYVGLRLMDETGSQSCGSACTTGVTADTNWHQYKISLDGTLGHASMDGVLRCSAADRYPQGPMGISYFADGDDSNQALLGIRYVEAWNQ